MPLMDIVGYCLPKRNAEGQSPVDLSEFRGLPCRCFEINHETKAILCINSKATGLASFDFDQIEKYFECQSFSGLLVPPAIDTLSAMQYVARVFSYPQNKKRDMSFISKMVIAASLSKGKFDDTLYFNFSNGS